MASGEDWLLRAVLRGMCKYESLKDGSLDLLDVVKMNEAMNVEYANKKILMESNQ